MMDHDGPLMMDHDDNIDIIIPNGPNIYTYTSNYDLFIYKPIICITDEKKLLNIKKNF